VEEEMITAKVYGLGMVTKEYTFDYQNPNVGDLVNVLDIDVSDMQMSIHGSNVTSSTILRDGDALFLAKRIKGNGLFSIKIITIGGSPIVTTAETGDSVSEILDRLGSEYKDRFVGNDGQYVFEFRSPDGTNLDPKDQIIFSGNEYRITAMKRTKGN